MGLNGWSGLRGVSRRHTRIALALLAVAAAGAAWQGSVLWRQARLDEAVAQALAAVPAAPASGAEAASKAASAAPGSEPLPLRFARAYALAAAGQHDAALEAYRPLQADSALGQAARYNSANLLLRQAVQVRQSEQPGQAIPLLELAKELYREVLRHEPGHWHARYNLERAQRLLPDPEVSTADAAELPRARERAATTVRGVAQGLP
jgi:mxaK protein